MSKIIRTRKPSVLPYYAAALVLVWYVDSETETVGRASE